MVQLGNYVQQKLQNNLFHKEVFYFALLSKMREIMALFIQHYFSKLVAPNQLFFTYLLHRH